MWQSILKAEPPPLPNRWGGLLEKWARGRADIPTDLKLDELREHWAENDIKDYTTTSAGNLRSIIDQVKVDLKEAPDEVGDLASNLTEKLIKFGKTKGQIKNALSKLEKLYKQLEPPNRYYDINVGGNTLESLGLVSPKGKTIDSWVVATLNRLYNNFVKDNSFENLQWLVKLVQEMQKQNKYKTRGAIKELIKNPKDAFTEKLSKYQSGPDAPPTPIMDAMKLAFDLTTLVGEKPVKAPTRAGTELLEPVTWNIGEEPPKKKGDLRSQRGGEIHDKIRSRRGRSPKLDPKFSEERDMLFKKIQELTKELKQSPNNKTIQRALASAQKEYDEFIESKGKFTDLEERGEEIYNVPPDFTQNFINTSMRPFRNLFTDLRKAGVDNQLTTKGVEPLTWFRKRGIAILHNLAFGDAVTQDISAKFTPIDKITKDLDTSLRETRRVKQKQFIEGYINQQKKLAGEAQFEIEGVRLNLPVDEHDERGSEESRFKEATAKLSNALTEGTNSDLNTAWGKHLLSKGEDESAEHSLDRKVGRLSSDKVNAIFGLGGEGVYKRNIFTTLLFTYYDSEDSIDNSSEWRKTITGDLKVPTSSGAFIPSNIQFDAPDADSFIDTLQVLLTYIKVWLGNEVLTEYTNRLNDTIAKFGDNIEEFVKDNADKFDEDADDKREILLTVFNSPESFNEVGGDWFGVKDDLIWLEKKLNSHFKTIAANTVPNYFEELIRQIGNNTIVSPKKQRVKSKGIKVTIKDKLLDLGYLTRE